ncbi:hypothetical protein ACI65C_002060 [Semiaphis heraclei]
MRSTASNNCQRRLPRIAWLRIGRLPHVFMTISYRFARVLLQYDTPCVRENFPYLIDIFLYEDRYSRAHLPPRDGGRARTLVGADEIRCDVMRACDVCC